MTTSEMISVMQAFNRGEQIEYRIKDFMRDDEWYVQKAFLNGIGEPMIIE